MSATSGPQYRLLFAGARAPDPDSAELGSVPEPGSAADSALGSGPAGWLDRLPPLWSADQRMATASVSAEAEQGDGPAAASASASAAADTPETAAVSVVVGPNGAAAACPFGVVVVGPHGAAAASQVGVAAVNAHGASSASNAANSCQVAVENQVTEGERQ